MFDLFTKNLLTRFVIVFVELLTETHLKGSLSIKGGGDKYDGGSDLWKERLEFRLGISCWVTILQPDPTEY